MTNYERIRNMSLEEMADFLRKNHSACCYCAYSDKRCIANKDMLCKGGICEYLESEVKEE